MCTEYQMMEISDISTARGELFKAMSLFDISKVRTKPIYSTSDSDSSSKKETESDSSTTKYKVNSRPVPLAEILERKIDHLTGLLSEQTELILSIKKEVSRSNIAVQHTVDTHAKLASELLEIATDERNNGTGKPGLSNSSAGLLMAGLSVRQNSLETEQIKKILEDILLSQQFKDQLTECTTTALGSVLNSSLLQSICSCYLPALHKSQCRVIKEVSKILDSAFRKLETNGAMFAQESARAHRSMRMALDHHLVAMETAAKVDNDFSAGIRDTVHDALESELSKWRMSVLAAQAHAPVTPHSPFHISRSPFDFLLKLDTDLYIEKHNAKIIKAYDDINRSFERALSAIDLELVVAACRTADPAEVFGPPCRLRQDVLLSLIQQLSTDLSDETQLKCRYIEESIMGVEKDNLFTQAHVAKVFTESKQHLKRFLSANPGHAMTRRIKMIVMASESFLIKLSQ